MIFVIALVALLVVLVGVFFAFKKMTSQPEQSERRSSIDYDSTPPLRDKVADSLDMPPPPTAADTVAPTPAAASDEGFDEVKIEKTFELGDDAFGGAEVSTVSEAEVDDLTKLFINFVFG